MTARQLFEYALIELNKVQAPSLLLEDYNYFINKAVNQYINKVYNLYDINQQKTDDLRVLKSSAMLSPIDGGTTSMFGDTDTDTPNALFGKNYEVDLPDDYLHILNCIVEYKVSKQFKCYDTDTTIHFGAIRLTADMYSQIINNYYMRPMYKRPYYYINNYNVVGTKPINRYPVNDSQEGVEFIDDTKTENNVETTTRKDNVERKEGNRYGNKSKVRMEIRYGKDNDIFELNKIYIDYLKAPQHIRLTQTQVDEVEDKSQELEFPDYVSQEIVNELIKLLMENASDPRLQTNIPINQTIANPAQEQQEQRKR